MIFEQCKVAVILRGRAVAQVLRHPCVHVHNIILGVHVHDYNIRCNVLGVTHYSVHVHMYLLQYPSIHIPYRCLDTSCFIIRYQLHYHCYGNYVLITNGCGHVYIHTHLM